jgi:hypothetical protein
MVKPVNLGAILNECSGRGKQGQGVIRGKLRVKGGNQELKKVCKQGVKWRWAGVKRGKHSALHRHNTNNSKQIIPEKELHIFPRSVCLLCWKKICGPILGIYKSLPDT